MVGVVLDVGMTQTSVGYSGGELPLAVLRSMTGISVADTDSGLTQHTYIDSTEDGNNIYTHRLLYNSDGVIDNLDDLRVITAACLARLNMETLKGVDVTAIFPQTVIDRDEDKAAIYDLLFGEQGAKSVFLTSSALMSLYSTGNINGLVIHMDRFHTLTLPVAGQVIYTEGIFYTRIGSLAADMFLRSMICTEDRTFGNLRLPTSLSIVAAIRERSTTVLSKIEAQQLDALLDYYLSSIASTKQAFGNSFSASSMRKPLISQASAITVTEHPYSMPSDTGKLTQRTLKVAAESLLMGEIFFRAKVCAYTCHAEYTIPELVYTAMQALPAPIQAQLSRNIVLAGEVSSLPGLSSRLRSELQAIFSRRPDICGDLSLSTVSMPPHAAWIGGSVVSCLHVSKRSFVTKEQWRQRGLST